ncbi:MAG: DUF4249 domain-containing protein [Saprospiraceae bacterium]|nr:DUF4249 domain-containing protein [Saprospiraceae bacterium]
MDFRFNQQIFLVFCLAGLTALGCEDVVDVQTAEAAKQIVVDAWLTDQPVNQVIKLTYSQPYFDAEFAEVITGANVEVTTDGGDVFIFSETAAGTYTWSSENGETLGLPGTEFQLNIAVDGQELSATSLMQPTTEIDSIQQEYREEEFGSPAGVYTQVFARDLQGLGNTYWIKTYKNGQYLNKPEEINLAYDAGFDGGSQLDGLIFIPPIRELTNPIADDFPADEAPYKQGDVIRVEIHSLTLDAFEFMSMVRDQILNGTNTIFASPIANSPGNISSNQSGEKILGVFCVSAVTILEKNID